MYAGVDIGGTKVLAAVLDEHGKIVEQVRFPTPKNYDEFLGELAKVVDSFATQDFKAAGVGCPGRIDREHGVILRQANLPWKNEHLQADTEKILKCPVAIENDANLAGLSESMLHPKQLKILYITVSTGIGTAVVENQRLVPSMLDDEGGQVLVAPEGAYMTWEKYSSGRVLFEHFGKKLADIDPADTAAWKYVARHISIGLLDNIAIVQPQLIIIGGSVGTHFKKYGKYLKAELDKHALPVVAIPQVVEAKRPEEAVIYGCYDYAKQVYG